MNKTTSITKGGMYTALSIILIYVANITPTSKLTFLTIASAVIPLSILTTSLKSSAVVYAATGILGLLLGLRGAAVAYIMFFGVYGFIKYYIESLRKFPLEWILKLIFFNISFLIIYMLYKMLFLSIPTTKFPIYLIIAGAQVGFIIFDYALSSIITYIDRHFVKL